MNMNIDKLCENTENTYEDNNQSILVANESAGRTAKEAQSLVSIFNKHQVCFFTRDLEIYTQQSDFSKSQRLHGVL